MVIDFSNYIVFGIFIILTVFLITMGMIKKKSGYILVALWTYILMLITHIICAHRIENSILFNLVIDFIGVVITIVPYIVIDDIEARRGKINEVFENKY